MIDKFYLFSDMNRDNQTCDLEFVFSWGNKTRIVAMGDEEHSYLFSMQLMLGSVDLIDFQSFHDKYWDNGNYKKQDLYSFLGTGPIFCTDPQFLDYMMDWQGDFKWQKNVRKKAHWSQPAAQHPLLTGFL